MPAISLLMAICTSRGTGQLGYTQPDGRATPHIDGMPSQSRAHSQSVEYTVAWLSSCLWCLLTSSGGHTEVPQVLYNYKQLHWCRCGCPAKPFSPLCPPACDAVKLSKFQLMHQQCPLLSYLTSGKFTLIKYPKIFGECATFISRPNLYQ